MAHAALCALLLCASFRAGQVRAATIYAITNQNVLLRFDSATPQTLIGNTNVSGISSGGNAVGLDFRPSNGKLYLVTRDGSGVGRIYTIDTATSTATFVSTISANLLSGSFGSYGVDFDPINDCLRLVNDSNQNLRIDVDSGTTTVDTALSFAPADTNQNTIPRIIAAAYDDNGRLFDYAFDIDTLVRQNPPNDGILMSIGSTGIFATGPVKLDIERSTARALASTITAANGYSLYDIDLATGAFARIGNIGDGNMVIRGLAITRARVQFSAANFSVDENAGSAIISVMRTDANSALSVDYATNDGTAKAGSEYTATSGTLNFASGQNSATFTVPISDNALDEDNKTFTLTLSNPIGGPNLGTPSMATLTIIDDDSATLTLSIVPTTFSETAGVDAASGTVSRNTPLDGPLTVTLLSNSIRVSVPDSVIIPTGQNSVDFALGAVDNAIVDGAQSIAITASSSGLDSATTSVTITDNDFNPPRADSQNASTNEDTPLGITLSGRSERIAPAQLHYRVLTPPQQGVLNGRAPNLVYTPNPNFNGNDVFTFVVSDGEDSAPATIALQVLAINDAPLADNQQLSADNATPLPITLGASDIDNDALIFAIAKAPDNGTLSGIAPNLIYTANPGFRGTDSIAFTVSDGSLTSQSAVVQIAVDGTLAVVANDDAFNLILGASGQAQQNDVTLLSSGVFQITAPGILRNDSFATGSALVVSALNNPANGRFQMRSDGTLFYLPSTNRIGADEFRYSISDGKTTANAAVRLNIIDQRSPELRFDSPFDRATVATIRELRGRVRDRNAGVQSMTLLWRRFDGAYWNGLTWTTTPVELPLRVEGIDWKYIGAVPVAGTDRTRNLLDGRYDLRVSATDQSGNLSRVINRITVDNFAPQLQIVQPVASNNETADLNNPTPLLGFDEISGRARDANGVARIELELCRASDGAYWNGNAFTSAPARFRAQLAPNGDWKANTKTPVKIPTLEQLKLGTYLIRAFAYDRLGNQSQAQIAVQLVQTAQTDV